MSEKILPFNAEQVEQWTNSVPTPFYVYDEAGIRATAQNLTNTFKRMTGFKEYFAVKATPNPHILRVLKSEGFGADCSSLPELIMADNVGIRGENIMFTSNDTPASEFTKAKELGAIINLDDISHIRHLEQAAGIPDLICFRYNPGPLREGNTIIGKPEEAKYGLTKPQLFEAYKTMRDKGTKRFGLHTMIASNELNPYYFVETANMLFDLTNEIADDLKIRFEFINIGGGIGIPYKPEQQPVDLQVISEGIKRSYEEKIIGGPNDPLKMFMECGRMITGPHGYLISRVAHLKDTYKQYVGLDACMANLMRPALYGAYHHITVLGKEGLPHNKTYDVTGSLCENNDKFAIDRLLPQVEEGDLVVIHDAGAHGYAMGFQYNGKLRCAELMLSSNGKLNQIRRAETVADYFQTLDFTPLDN